ncbi:unnamed protein product [Rodentolepis nana]|uniref:Uncharacterized protein n=1 Tax=Rodentolepis nana TaxID=102285 RepID=A0A3P7SZG1_RODNA|nr:unnamed protein product [Rodentolepis nana]
MQCNGTRTTPDLLLASSDISKIIDDPGSGHKPVREIIDDPGSGHKPSFYHRQQKHDKESANDWVWSQTYHRQQKHDKESANSIGSKSEAKRKRDALRNTADQCKRDALRNTADQTGRDALCNTADQTGSGTPFAILLITLEEKKTYKPGDDNQLS